MIDIVVMSTGMEQLKSKMVLSVFMNVILVLENMKRESLKATNRIDEIND
jgi:ABC-type uncharacterized transport system permease subunit